MAFIHGLQRSPIWCGMCGHLVFHCAHVSAAVSAAVYPCAVSTHRLRTLDEGGELPPTARKTGCTNVRAPLSLCITADPPPCRFSSTGRRGEQGRGQCMCFSPSVTADDAPSQQTQELHEAVVNRRRASSPCPTPATPALCSVCLCLRYCPYV